MELKEALQISLNNLKEILLIKMQSNTFQEVELVVCQKQQRII
jgi:hypothetical protein